MKHIYLAAAVWFLVFSEARALEPANSGRGAVVSGDSQEMPISKEQFMKNIAENEEWINGENGSPNPDKINEKSEELQVFEKRLSQIRAQSAAIIRSYATKRISREAAKEKLIPLLTEEKEILNNPEYIAELKLCSASENSSLPEKPAQK